jgi:EAL domain-containing protein (putative c-di-GMP-specific phosphodiesterase class I)
MRCQHPELGLLSPERFIQVAEETRLIIPISEWILRNACAQNKVWQEAGFPSLRVAVNLSAHHFKREHFAETIVKILKETRLAPNYLELELTESTMMENAETNAVVLNELKEMGISLSIDDFGTGYSSLSYLKRLPINTLKIDQSFIWDISIDPDDTAITRAIIALAHNLKLKVVAEGVETKEQLAFLCQHQCDEVQGYLFSKPVLAEVLTQILREGRRLPPDNWNYPLDS